MADRVLADADDIEQLRAEIARLQADCETLRWAVCHDELTGLANRRLFSTLAPKRLRSDGVAVVLLLDLNGFKPINDAYGHEAGDRVLQIVAERLDACVDEGLVARLGGDEFVGVLSRAGGSLSRDWWIPTVRMLLDTISSPMTVAGRSMKVTASIGVAAADTPIAIADLMHRADIAMYEAKIHGRGYAIWDAQLASGANLSRGVRQFADVDPAQSLSKPVKPEDMVPGAPTIDPYRRVPAEVAPAGTYQPSDPVWVYRHGCWHPGVVESASRRAVMATYRRNAGAGTVVDTMGAECVLARVGVDPQLDRMAATRLGSVA